MSWDRGWRKGKYLVMDEESGLVRYNTQVMFDGYGKLTSKRYADRRHPQEFVKARQDPYPVPFTRPENITAEYCAEPPLLVGNTTVFVLPGPGFNPDAEGVGEMEIGCNFTVR